MPGRRRSRPAPCHGSSAPLCGTSDCSTVSADDPRRMPISTKPSRRMPRTGVLSRQRTANKRSKSLTAVLAIRLLTCSSS